MPIIIPGPTGTEQLEFDPAGEDTGSPLVVTSGGYGLLAHAYPTPAISAQWTSSVDTEGARLASQKHENREIPLTIDCESSALLYQLQRKISKLYREGGTLQRTLPNGEALIFDVETVSGFDPSFDDKFDLADVSTVSVTLICKPYARGSEEDLGDNTTTGTALVFTEATVAGDLPALGRLVIDNDTANAQKRVIWGLRSRYYDSASTAALLLEAEAAQAIAPAAAAVGPAGASGGGANKVIRHTNLTGPGTFDGIINIGNSSGAATHVGVYRVFARVQVPASNVGTVSVRLTWRPFVAAPEILCDPVPVTATGIPLEGFWALIELGEVRLPEATVGTQGWAGRIEASSTTAGDDIDLDYVLLVPVSEGSGEVVSVSTDAIEANSTVEIRHDSAWVKKAATTAWRKPDVYEGDYLLIPPSGAETRTLEIVVKQVRYADIDDNSVTSGPGDVTDASSARLYVTPRYLTVPAS